MTNEMKKPSALKKIKQIEKEWKEYVVSVPIPYDRYHQNFLLKAVKVLREINLELYNQHLYRQYLNKQIPRKGLKVAQEHVDRAFELSMELGIEP